MITPNQLEEITQTAAIVLSQKWDADIHLTKPQIIRQGERNVTIRCHTLQNDSPPTVVIKKANKLNAIGFIEDWAAGEFLNQLPETTPLVPKFYGGNQEMGFIILEDLGTGKKPIPYDLLKGKDPDQASQGILELTSVIGKLHANTLGKFNQYDTIRTALGPTLTGVLKHPWAPAQKSPVSDQDIADIIARYHTVLQTLNIQPESNIEEEIEHTIRHVEEDPGPWLAYCQGDQNTPGNCIYSDNHLKLIDFEAGGYRHALLEGMPGRITWGCTMRLPKNLIAQMETCYQNELAQNLSDASNNTLYRRAMVEAGARWHLFHVIVRLRDALEKDYLRGTNEFATTLRQQVCAWINAFADLSNTFNHMPLLGKTARRISEQLNRHWPKEITTLPFYPVFREKK